MEFRYSEKNYQNVPKIFAAAIILATIMFFVRSQEDGIAIARIIPFLAGVNLVFLLIGIVMYRSYKYKWQTTVIVVNDEGVSFRQKSGAVNILWPDIKRVEWEEPNRYSPGAINIISENNRIRITMEVEDFKVIVQEIKSKVGDRFITYNIPLEYK